MTLFSDSLVLKPKLILFPLLLFPFYHPYFIWCGFSLMRLSCPLCDTKKYTFPAFLVMKSTTRSSGPLYLLFPVHRTLFPELPLDIIVHSSKLKRPSSYNLPGPPYRMLSLVVVQSLEPLLCDITRSVEGLSVACPVSTTRARSGSNLSLQMNVTHRKGPSHSRSS